tara:strand:- start:1670 stop:2041 length:372 start_codon:yes stop_codon:yes gene_type:complete
MNTRSVGVKYKQPKTKVMLEEKDLPHANSTNKRSTESDGAYNSALNNIIIGIHETTYKGQYEYTHPQKLPKSFCVRLSNCFKHKGYEVDFKDNPHDYKDEPTINIMGWEIEFVVVSIKWHYIV